MLAPPETLAALAGNAEAKRSAAERAAKSPEDRARERELEERRQWEEMLAHTRAVMAEIGFPEGTLDALLASVEAKRLGRDPFARHIAAAHLIGLTIWPISEEQAQKASGKGGEKGSEKE